MPADIDKIAGGISRERPVLIAGPTASGKSALAMEIAARTAGPVVNADAMQVFADWRVLTARPGPQDEAALPHRLYGHVPGDRAYSVGDWLREVASLLDGPPPVIVGGTGLYFTALTEGLAEIPPTPPEIRAEAMARIGAGGLAGMLAELDAATLGRIDRLNPMRVQRAWEVLRSTGRGIASWQDETGAAMLPEGAATRIVLNAPPDWLNPRIERRLEAMLAGGALEEARANAPDWRADLPSAKAIGAAELIAVVRGEATIESATETIATLTRQYAKRQRSWFRGRMQKWIWIDPEG